jgi:hypothetical protein
MVNLDKAKIEKLSWGLIEYYTQFTFDNCNNPKEETYLIYEITKALNYRKRTLKKKYCLSGVIRKNQKTKEGLLWVSY